MHEGHSCQWYLMQMHANNQLTTGNEEEQSKWKTKMKDDSNF
jgi:hypothetical protein